MIFDFWYRVRRCLIVLALLLVFFTAAECLRIYILLYRANPLLAFGFAALAPLALLLAARYLFPRRRRLISRQSAVGSESSHARLTKACHHLRAYLRQLAQNRHLTPPERELALGRITELVEILNAHPLRDDLIRALEQTDRDIITPIMARLNRESAQEIEQHARQALQLAAGSPFPGLDLAGTLLKTGRAVQRIIDRVANRANPPERMAIARDIAGVVLRSDPIRTMRLLHAGLMEKLPAAGPAVDALARGLGGAWLTLLIGRAAMDRCAAAYGWDAGSALDRLETSAAEFADSVATLLDSAVLAAFKQRLRCLQLEAPADDTILHALRSVLKGTAHALNKPFRPLAGTHADLAALTVPTPPPAIETLPGAPAPEAAAAEPAPSPDTAPQYNHHRHRRPLGWKFLRALETFGQRMKYGIKGRRLYK